MTIKAYFDSISNAKKDWREDWTETARPDWRIDWAIPASSGINPPLYQEGLLPKSNITLPVIFTAAAAAVGVPIYITRGQWESADPTYLNSYAYLRYNWYADSVELDVPADQQYFVPTSAELGKTITAMATYNSVDEQFVASHTSIMAAGNIGPIAAEPAVIAPILLRSDLIYINFASHDYATGLRVLTSNSLPELWTGTAPITYSFVWKVDSVQFSTDETVELTAELLALYHDSTVTCEITATNAGGSSTFTASTIL